MNVEICRWQGGRTFAYSITYDEGFVDLLEHALPVHRKYEVPGHLVVLAGQLGQVRHVPSSTYDGTHRHLSGLQLRVLMAEGWSVGDHSMTHGDLNVDPYNEIVTSKRVLEDATGQAVNLFHLPGADFSYAPAARYIDQAGFLAVFFTDDRVNSDDPDLFGLGRALVYVREGRHWHNLYSPYPRVYDPYHRLHEARACGGWLVDMTHLVTHDPPAPWKDTTPELLDARFDCLRRVGGGREWAAEPEEVVDYVLMRRATTLEQLPDAPAGQCFRVHLAALPASIKHRSVSLAVTDAVPQPSSNAAPEVWLDDQRLAGRWITPGTTVFDCTPREGALLVIGAGPAGLPAA
jgi:peptidoglycan/xylan/chitin deacetylase (PgdA/CDA1 family)